MEFPGELRLFSERVGERRVPALIIPGSRQATTAALLVGALAPQRVAFLLTPDSLTMPDQVAALLGAPPDDWARFAEDHTDALQIYRSLRAIIDTWADLPRAQIAVDLTGGTKPMSVGLAKAAYVLGIDALYIESDYGPGPDGRFGPIPGTQRLVPPPDPYVIFGDLEAAEAVRLYAAHDYAGAEQIFAGLARRLQGAAADGGDLAVEAATLATRYAALADLSAAYRAWDAFDPREARERLKTYLAAVPSDPHAAPLRAQAQTLATLDLVVHRAAGRGRDALATLADPEALLPLLGSLYANARRREAQGRFDTAALLRYRCLELISQHRLATWGLLTERPDFSALLARRPSLDADYRAVEERVGFYPRGLSRPGRNGRVAPLALFGGYMLLAALDDPLVAGFDIEQIRERSAARNTSILAHGYRLITDDEYRRFASVVEELLGRLFGVLGRDRAAWEASVTFVPLE